MRSALGDLPTLQHDDYVAIIDGSQSVRNKDAGAGFLAYDTADVLKDLLLGVGVKRGSLQNISMNDERILDAYSFVEEQ